MTTDIWTVSIKDLFNLEADIFTSSFSTSELAYAFKSKCEDTLHKHNRDFAWQVSVDKGFLDDTDTYHKMLVEDCAYWSKR